MSKERKEAVTTHPPIILSLVSVLFLVTSIFEFWGLYLTGFKMFTFALLAAAGLIATVGLFRLKPWGLWLSYALYLPQMVQAATVLWSLILLEGFPASSFGGLLRICLGAYLILLTLSILLLWRKRGVFQ